MADCYGCASLAARPCLIERTLNCGASRQCATFSHQLSHSFLARSAAVTNSSGFGSNKDTPDRRRTRRDATLHPERQPLGPYKIERAALLGHSMPD